MHDPARPARQRELPLLREYVKAVRTYLPMGADADDVTAELDEALRSKMEDREQELGRPLTELEQQALLARYGSPLAVASRYGTVNHGLAFGRQLIGPELFPIYLRALAFVFGLDVIFVPFLLFSPRPVLTNPLQIVVPMLFQLILVTSVFVGIHTLRFWSHRRAVAADARDAWLFPGAYLRPTPRWLSAAGGVVMGLIALWWVAVPRTPALAIGAHAAAVLELAPPWSRFHWPILVLLVAGVVHRVVSLVRPDWNWLRPAALLSINAAALALLYPILRGGPLFEVAAAADASAEAHRLARAMNDDLWWYLVGFGSYWLVNAAINARLCVQLLRYRLRRRSR